MMKTKYNDLIKEKIDRIRNKNQCYIMFNKLKINDNRMYA